jgi:pSer/pThr/pTyr-binding forkhead associated (FHA) protein
VSAVPRFVIHHDGRRILLPEGETLIGRSLDCRIRFNDPAVSRRHLRLVVERGCAMAWNLGTNGTLLNGAPLTEPRLVADGDEVRLGFQRLRVEVLDEASVPVARHPVALDQRLARASSIPIAPEGVAGEYTEPGEEGWRQRRMTEEVLLPSRLAEIRIPPADVASRRSPRFLIAVPVIYSSETLIIDAVVRDLSRGGMFIATDVLDPIGTPCDVTAMPEGRPGLRFAGVVAHVADQPSVARVHGLGIQLVDGSPDAMSWLEQTISDCSQALIQ